ncbi:hypothetical protein OG427_02375 [Streptomyces sp. NBC_00133]|uniref:hypothetical protein n=1 Tax=Streptomyces sp. NBC_00133 TaxID=2903624 RepID=UPI003254D280
MALSPKWEELFNADTPDEQMQLASAGPGNGSNESDLKASKGPWTTAAGVADQLHTKTKTSLTDLNLAHEGLTWGLEGFTIGATLAEVRRGWEKRLRSVRDECARLDGVLKSVGKDFGEIEVDIRRSFRNTSPDARQKDR